MTEITQIEEEKIEQEILDRMGLKADDEMVTRGGGKAGDLVKILVAINLPALTLSNADYVIEHIIMHLDERFKKKEEN
jgi:hypothetical protein